jgi:hypothetical protein
MKLRHSMTLSTLILLAASGLVLANVTGVVYNDLNKNGKQDAGEAGLSGVYVSNSKEVVKTDAQGRYTMPSYDDMVVFVVKPSGWMTPVDGNNVPRFYYIHKPAGSPAEVKQFAGIKPTGPLPASVDFPLYKTADSVSFKAVINGDTQAYNNTEIEYVRDSFVKDVTTNNSDARFCISMGDNLGDDLSLYPRYLATMGAMGMPVYYVPGNHDNNYDNTKDEDSCDTFKNLVGPTYYSFNYGKVHFVIMDSVIMTKSSYVAGITDTEMTWLANDLATVPQDNLIVLNMHIPIVSDWDTPGTQHQVSNRVQLYNLLSGRNAVSLAGHTHTCAHFFPGDQLDGWNQPTPIPQIIVGAVCGAWWASDIDDAGVPTSYMRCGAPHNYQVFEFNGNQYMDTFKSLINGSQNQMHVSLLTDSFRKWFNTNSDVNTPTDKLLSRNSLITRNVVKTSELATAKLVTNVYNGGSHTVVMCQFDGRDPIQAFKDFGVMDPFAVMNEVYILRGVVGYKLYDKSYQAGTAYGTVGTPWIQNNGNWTLGSSAANPGRGVHIWNCDVPADLTVGMHKAIVGAVDSYGRYFEDTLVFEVVK